MEEITLDPRSITIIIKKFFFKRKERVIVKSKVYDIIDENGEPGIKVRFKTIGEGEDWEKPIPEEMFEKIVVEHMRKNGFEVNEVEFVKDLDLGYKIVLRGSIKTIEDKAIR